MTTHPGFIDSINRFVRLTEAEVSAILPLMKNSAYQKGQHLTQQGETENYLYFISERCIRNYTDWTGLTRGTISSSAFNAESDGTADSGFSPKPFTYNPNHLAYLRISPFAR